MRGEIDPLARPHQDGAGRMTAWMEEQEHESLRQMWGSMNIARSPNAQEYARANDMQILQTWHS